MVALGKYRSKERPAGAKARPAVQPTHSRCTRGGYVILSCLNVLFVLSANRVCGPVNEVPSIHKD